ncbi:MAG: cobalamin biosynthesis protein CbiX [Alphaproteobacteria bacterium]|nr:cobalamin biosynthesis protein CbiX [Alphaproteobacteria bacterium]
MKQGSFAVVVAHGSPSEPEPLDRAIKDLAARVSAAANGMRVEGATLAKTGSLEAALAQAIEGERLAIYPFFMSDGWFVSSELRRRVGLATNSDVTYLDPFGLDEALPPLCVRRASEAIGRMGGRVDEATLVLAAHGSQRSQASAEAAMAVQRRISAVGAFGDVRLGFVEQAPTIAKAAAGLTGRTAVCLPLFATTAGHVIGDIPEQLEQAEFRGAVMAPIGEDAEVPGLIGRAISAGGD